MDTQQASADWGFFENLSEGIVILSQDGTVVHANRTARDLLQIYHLPETLREIHNIGRYQHSWAEWEALLTPPAQLYLQTDIGYTNIQSNLITRRGNPHIQLVIQASSHVTQLPEGAGPDELNRYIDMLRHENKTLLRRAEQVERLRILSDASREITSGTKTTEVLKAMGKYALMATEAIGYSIFIWKAEKQSFHFALDHVDVPQSQNEHDKGMYEARYHDDLWQILKENTLIITENTDYVPGRPLWRESAITTYQTLALPIYSGEDPYGVLVLARNKNESELDENAFDVLSTIIAQTSVTLEKVRLFADMAERERFLDSLGRVSLAVNGTLDLQNVLSKICDESRKIFAIDGVYIRQLVNENDEHPQLLGVAAEGHQKDAFIGSQISLTENNTFSTAVVNSRESQFINNFKQHANLLVYLPEAETIEAVMGLPLIHKEKVLGVLLLVDRHQPERFTQRDIERANTFAVQVAIALRNAHLVTKLRTLNNDLDRRVANRTADLGQERDRFRILLRIASELVATLEEHEVLNRTLSLLSEVIPATEGAILLASNHHEDMMIRAEFGNGRAMPAEGIPSGIKPNEGLGGWIMLHQRSVIVSDLENEDRWIEKKETEHLRSVLGAPLTSRDGVMGVLMLFHVEKDAFTDEHLRLVEAAATQASNTIYNAGLYMRVRQQTDQLAGMLREEQVSAAKNQAILESVADGILVSNENGEVILVNDALIDILGVPRERIVNRDVRELSGLYGSSGDLWISTIEEWADNTADVQERPSLADTLNIEDEDKIVSAHLAPVFVEGQFFGTVSILRDITKDVEVDRMKTEFVSTVSHELRTPLTSIKGYTDLLLMGATGQVPDAQLRYLEVIKSNADRLQELVNDLLDISRIETGKTELKKRPMDIAYIVDQVVHQHLRGRIENSGKQINARVSIPQPLPLVNADQARVTQILTNLVDNAYNYTPEDGSITVHAQAGRKFVHVSVTDTGIGISTENLDKIFDRFYRSNDARVQKVSGTGLGLAIVQSLVEMHGGSLTVDTEVGRGSTFSFNLPLVVEEGQPIE